MCDLQVLAYQADLTRVVTFMLGREFSGVTYPQIGVPDAHHPITHHQQEPEKIAKVAKINAYHVTQFAYLLDRLRSTPDGDGSLLDHVTHDVRDRHGRLQRPRSPQHSAAAGGRRRGSAQGRTSHPVSEGDAAREPAPDAARQARRAAGIGSATAPAGSTIGRWRGSELRASPGPSGVPHDCVPLGTVASAGCMRRASAAPRRLTAAHRRRQEPATPRRCRRC